MGLVVTTLGENHLIENALKATSTPEAFTLKLYKNNYTPVAGSTSGNFTEADFTGYSSVAVARSDWGSASQVSGKAKSIVSTITFTCSGTGNTVYGYYLVGATSGDVYWAELFSTARTLASADTLDVNLSFELNSVN